MSRREQSESEPELEESKSNEGSSEEEETHNHDDKIGEKGEGMPEYERQRLERIAKNRARMESLGLHKIASSLKSPAVRQPSRSEKSAQRKGKRKVEEDDEDYEPNQDEGSGDDADRVEDVDSDSDVHSIGRRSASKPRRNKNNNGSTPRKGVAKQKKQRKSFESASYVDENEELMQAIALSFHDSAKLRDRKAATTEQEATGRIKNKKSFSSRVKMTEDDLIMYFFQFDERGSGTITQRDIERVATSHDFTWSDKELADMVDCFDGDGDGKLSLDDFRKAVSRCNMLQQSEDS